MNNKEDFKPYIPADKITPEFTFASIFMGVLLAIIFGAANAYLGLRVGMTVSASIPAAVISMAVIRVILKKDSVLESNMVQTIGSAGESLAAGTIFTLPALFLWASEGVMDSPDLIEITVIALCGGLLGVLFMVPLRNALIVKEHGVLPYPEGTACAEVLLAGEEGGASAKSVFLGMGISAVAKLLVDGFGVISGVIVAPIKALKTELSMEVYPALFSVGYICGFKISAYMLAGGLIGWFVLIPAIVTFGGDTILYPATVSISELYASGGAGNIWDSYIRYIGAGAVAAGGIISLFKSLPLIVTTFRDAIRGMKGSKKTSNLRTDADLPMNFIGIGVIVMILILWALPQIPVSLLGAIIIVVFGFFFATVSSRMVGLVGSSNNPVSGMAIATLLISTALLKATGDIGAHGMQGAIAIGSIICIVAAMAGDTSQDLKTGYILGATPKKQQMGEIIGSIVSALTIGGVLVLLNYSFGYGTAALPAPQAMLMKMIVEGVMDGNLPWALVFIGAFISIAFELVGIPALPVAIGLYLPLELSTTIAIGGVIRLVTDKLKKKSGNEEKNADAGNGILFCSGMIAGEGLVGVLLAVLTAVKVADKLNFSGILHSTLVGPIVLSLLLCAFIIKTAMDSNNKKAK